MCQSIHSSSRDWPKPKQVVCCCLWASRESTVRVPVHKTTANGRDWNRKEGTGRTEKGGDGSWIEKGRPRLPLQLNGVHIVSETMAQRLTGGREGPRRRTVALIKHVFYQSRPLIACVKRFRQLIFCQHSHCCHLVDMTGRAERT